MQTGFYGIPGSAKGSFTVHAVNNGRPLCGWRPSGLHQFQWCAHVIYWPYLECAGCKAKARAISTTRN